MSHKNKYKLTAFYDLKDDCSDSSFNYAIKTTASDGVIHICSSYVAFVKTESLHVILGGLYKMMVSTLGIREPNKFSFTVLIKVSFRMFVFPTSNHQKILVLEMLISKASK